MHLKTCRQNANNINKQREKSQPRRLFSQNEQNWRWNKEVLWQRNVYKLQLMEGLTICVHYKHFNPKTITNVIN